MKKAAKTVRNVLKEGLAQGQKEVGIPNAPITKEAREEAGKKVVANIFVRFWNYLFGR